MKKLTALLLLPILAAALTATRYQDRGTAELPPEIAANLRSVPNMNLLMSVPYPDGYVDKALAKIPPTPDERDCGSTEFYWVQVLFPITVCTTTNEPSLSAMTGYLGPGPVPPFDLPPPAVRQQPAQNFKLSALPGTSLGDPFNCVIRSGPWLAEVIYYRECDRPEKYTLEILGVPSCPGCLFFTWAPPFENHPPEIIMVQPLVYRKTSGQDCNRFDHTECPGVPGPQPTPAPPPA